MLGDHEIISKSMIQNLALQKPLVQFNILIGKTNTFHVVTINEELLQIMKIIKWNGFHPKTL